MLSSNWSFFIRATLW